MEITSLILLLIISFVTSIIGTLIGTAMLIMPPAMIFLGVPVHTAIATARFSMLGIGIGNITKFSLQDRINLKYALPFAIAGIFGALFGASLLAKIEENVLKIIIGILMISISLLVLFEDRIKPSSKRKQIRLGHYALSIIAGLFIGAYIGVIGGGGATIIIFLLVLIYGLNFKDAVANQKAVTLPMTITATIIFVYQGLIDYKLGVPLLLTNLLGGWVGAGLLLNFKNKWLKIILIPIMVIMAVKLIFF
ncbi:sulfite exporter TauE/SafE family protein [Candidatus Woesearchaeota archaeon]|nr:sulfite exporter TauE/SafE family protein [Candidatus Woesearchaeota archaeon]